MQRIKARAPPSFKPQVLDTEKRINILFDHLNNEDLLKPDTISEMNELAQALQARQHEDAHAVLEDIMRNKMDEGSNWMVRCALLVGLIVSNLNPGWGEAADRNEPSNATVDFLYNHFYFKEYAL